MMCQDIATFISLYAQEVVRENVVDSSLHDMALLVLHDSCFGQKQQPTGFLSHTFHRH